MDAIEEKHNQQTQSHKKMQNQKIRFFSLVDYRSEKESENTCVNSYFIALKWEEIQCKNDHNGACTVATFVPI